MIKPNLNRNLTAATLLLTLTAIVAPLASETKVKVRAGDTIEIFAKTHLKNPRHWRRILKFNQLNQRDFQPGVEVLIPRGMERKGDASVREVQPSAVFSRKLRDSWATIFRDLKLFSGDRIKTDGNGSVRLVLRNLMQVHIKPKTRVILSGRPDQDGTDLFLQNGRIRSFQTVPGKVSMKVVTPAAVAAVRGTDFAVEVADDGGTIVSCYEGAVEVSAQGKRLLLREGSSVAVEPGSPPGAVRSLPSPPAPRGR